VFPSFFSRKKRRARKRNSAKGDRWGLRDERKMGQAEGVSNAAVLFASFCLSPVFLLLIPSRPLGKFNLQFENQLIQYFDEAKRVREPELCPPRESSFLLFAEKKKSIAFAEMSITRVKKKTAEF
jgi:hypothetical protein